MKYNPYYNNSTMNLKQLSYDLYKQGYECELNEETNTLIVARFYILDFIKITLTSDKYWRVSYHQVFNEIKIYTVPTNWSVIKLLRKLLIDAK